MATIQWQFIFTTKVLQTTSLMYIHANFIKILWTYLVLYQSWLECITSRNRKVVILHSIYQGKISTQKFAHLVHMPENTIPTRKGEKIAGEPLNKIENTRRKRRTLEYIWELKKYLFGGRLATRSLAEVCSLPGGLPNPLCTFQCSPTFLHFAFLSASCI